MQQFEKHATFSVRITNLAVECYLSMQISLHINFKVSDAISLEMFHLGKHCVRNDVCSTFYSLNFSLRQHPSIFLYLVSGSLYTSTVTTLSDRKKTNVTSLHLASCNS